MFLLSCVCIIYIIIKQTTLCSSFASSPPSFSVQLLFSLLSVLTKLMLLMFRLFRFDASTLFSALKMDGKENYYYYRRGRRRRSIRFGCSS